MKEVALGIDIGGTNTVFGFIDKEVDTPSEVLDLLTSVGIDKEHIK